ncbi:uncharacterized protein LOC124312378 [Daphnia pulicaria]|uniref:uncharacterized protein LOC124312378 n=1 Tax=Daphnia pulicaria TaxID=35523 RepID=UPI001EEB0D07|nr:uncharacterized protein LOC124312378 [Daphnia pulicaria]
MELLLTLVMAVMTTNALSVEVDQVRQLQENYEILAGKFHQLETKFQEQESTLRIFEKQIQDNMNKNSEHPPLSQNALPRTCQAARAANSFLTSGLYWIDPDGSATGDEPIRVYCNMNTGSTEVLHDSESPVDPGHCASPGCYFRPINYKASSRQMAALAELSVQCSQSIKYDCISSPLERNGISYAWWNDRNGNPQYFWSGSNSRVHVCQCGIEQTCFENDVRCNCDSNAKLQLVDQGVITRKKLLPITRLNFGGTHRANSTGMHTLGRFECDGRLSSALNKGFPTSCADLWRNGFVANGLYSIKGSKQVEKVYCDFNKLPSEPDFQTWIGYEDVKSHPVFFQVQKDADVLPHNSTIPFEIELLNVGSAMDISSGVFTVPRSGRYFFTLWGIKDEAAKGTELSLRLNGVQIAQTSSSYGGSYSTYSLQTTLNLQGADQISSSITSAALNKKSVSTYSTFFGGWLLEEDIFKN